MSISVQVKTKFDTLKICFQLKTAFEETNAHNFAINGFMFLMQLHFDVLMCSEGRFRNKCDITAQRSCCGAGESFRGKSSAEMSHEFVLRGDFNASTHVWQCCTQQGCQHAVVDLCLVLDRVLPDSCSQPFAYS